MKNLLIKKLFFILTVIVVSIFVGCDNNENIISDENKLPEELFVQNEYNQDLKNFALSVSKALSESEDFRKLIKKEALAKFDGDYDILFNKIADKPVKVDNDTQLRSDGTNSTVKDLLENCYSSNNLFNVSMRSAVSIISELQQKYPNLQISVPVNAEDWNENTTIPAITFIPLDYQDGITKSLMGINPDGSTFIVDAIHPPTEAMIVISENERIYKPLDPSWPVLPFYPIDSDEPSGDTVEPLAPTNLTATQTTEGIQLTWSQSTERHTLGYYIYRKGGSDADFILRAVNNGVNNRVYYDIATESGKTYSYYVVAYNNFGESGSSNIASAIGLRPSSPLSFEAKQHTNTQVELRWTVENQNYQTMQLYKQMIGTDNNYQLYKQFGTNIYDYFDADVTPGKKYNYKIQTVSSTGTSNPKYDYIRVPYRDPAYKSPVRIKSIYCNDDCEGWGRGAPEFTVKVLGVKTDGTTNEIQTLRINFNGNMFGWHRTQSFNILVTEWMPDSWYDKITFYVEEEDDRSESSVTLSASANYKATDDLTVQAAASITTKIKRGYTIGYGYLDYYDPTDITIQFPHSGFKMTMGI